MFRWPILLKSRRSWRVWGTQVELCFPSWKSDLNDMMDTRHSSPGAESLNFYDSAYHFRDNLAVHVGMATMENPEIPEELALRTRDGKDRQLVCSRRRYLNAWEVKCGDYSQSFWADVWVYRDFQHGSLFDPENLKQAQLDYLSYYRKQDENRRQAQTELNDAEDEGEEPFLEYWNEPAPEYVGLNWRFKAIGGYWWQGFDQCTASEKIAQQWFFPLGEGHYLGIRLYRMRVGFTHYVEFESAFERFANYLTDNLKLSPAEPEKLSALQAGRPRPSVNAIDAGQLHYDQARLENWTELDRDLREGKKLATARSREPFWERYSTSPVLFLVLQAFVIVSIVWGGFRFSHWLEAHELDQYSWSILLVMFGFDIAKRIRKFRDKLIEGET
jgi:hypothetical protein